MPGPAPLDRPAFPDEFLDECRILVRRRTVPHGQHQRARLVLVLHESPDLSNVAAGALVQLHVTSVHRWRHRWACGDFSLADQAGRGASPPFPPRDRAIVKAIACEAVCQTKLPLSRLSTSDLADQASTALGRSISPSTVWRILDTDAIKPWRYQCWIFPRDPKFSEKAGRILDLYAGSWDGKPLGHRDYIISSDEKTSIQVPSDVTRRFRPRRVVPCAWSMSTSEGEPCSTWPLGTFVVVESWVGARRKPGSTRLAAWSSRLCGPSPTGRPAVFFGS